MLHMWASLGPWALAPEGPVRAEAGFEAGQFHAGCNSHPPGTRRPPQAPCHSSPSPQEATAREEGGSGGVDERNLSELMSGPTGLAKRPSAPASGLLSFCPTDGNLLLVETASGTLRYYCQTCPYSYAITRKVSGLPSPPPPLPAATAPTGFGGCRRVIAFSPPFPPPPPSPGVLRSAERSRYTARPWTTCSVAKRPGRT